MVRVSTKWRLASARVLFSDASKDKIVELHNSGTKAYFQGGAFATWDTRHRMNTVFFDSMPRSDNYFRAYESLDEALVELDSTRGSAQSILTRFISTTISVTGECTIETTKGGHVLVHVSAKPHGVISKESSTIIRRLMLSLLALCGVYRKDTLAGIETDFCVQIGIFEKKFGLTFYYKLQENWIYLAFHDSTLQTPSLLPFLLPEITSAKNFVLKVHEIFRAEAVEYVLKDSVGDNSAIQPLDLPPPTGAWSIEAMGSYRKNFDPINAARPTTGSERFPLWSSCDSDNNRLLWHIDAIHTPNESFFDVQTGEGKEYLQRFLDEHGLQGEIWEGKFSERWNLTPAPRSAVSRSDAELTDAFIESLGSDFMDGAIHERIYEAPKNEDG